MEGKNRGTESEGRDRTPSTEVERQSETYREEKCTERGKRETEGRDIGETESEGDMNMTINMNM
jgi:hypothetical protein